VSFQAARSRRLTAGRSRSGKWSSTLRFLVADAPLHRDGAEHLVDGGPQRLAAVQDDEDALLDVQAPVDEV